MYDLAQAEDNEQVTANISNAEHKRIRLCHGNSNVAQLYSDTFAKSLPMLAILALVSFFYFFAFRALTTNVTHDIILL